MSTQPQYEFDQGQNSLISDLSSKMQGVGFIWRIVGFLFVGLAIVVTVVAHQKYNGWNFPHEIWGAISGHAFVGLFNFVIGGWTLSAARNFQKVAGSQGNDIGHLMNALRSLYQMFALIYSLMLFAILLVLISLGLGLYSLMQRGVPV